MKPSSLALLSLLALAASAATQTPQLLGHWRLDETSGTVASDASLFGNNGSLVGYSTPTWVAGKFGNGLKFDGVGNYVLVGISGGLPVYDARGTPFTVAFWIKAPGQSDRRVYSEQAATPSGSGPLFTIGSGSPDAVSTTKLRVFVRADDLVVATNTLSNAVVFDDTWHHVAYSEISGNGKIWIDGVLDKSFDYSRNSAGPAAQIRGVYSLNSVTLGAVVRNAAVATPLNGIVDDLRIYRCALTASDIATIKAGGNPGTCAAAIGQYGAGCGPGPLELVGTGSAALGSLIWLQAIRGTPGAPAYVCTGFGQLQPIDLGAIGWVGCTLYLQNPNCTGVGSLLPAGSSVPLPITVPNSPSLACLLVGFQAVAVGPTVEISGAVLGGLGK